MMSSPIRSKERLPFLLTLFDPAQCLPEKDVRAVALGFYKGVVVLDNRVEVARAGYGALRAGIILANAAGTVDKGYPVFIIGFMSILSEVQHYQ